MIDEKKPVEKLKGFRRECVSTAAGMFAMILPEKPTAIQAAPGIALGDPLRIGKPGWLVTARKYLLIFSPLHTSHVQVPIVTMRVLNDDGYEDSAIRYFGLARPQIAFPVSGKERTEVDRDLAGCAPKRCTYFPSTSRP